MVIFIWHKKIVEVGHNKKRPYIFVTNHISYLDSAMIPKAYRQPIRPLGKIEMSKVPVSLNLFYIWMLTEECRMKVYLR
ncbi:MAG: hypothetical protein IPL04_17675 [Chitinophagaceae bacterium]|nr:hypothetical protein [Chitinophagaceae bacterium]